ncbi:hypothetical protein RFI_23519 [Reticulomyxa filosa]|uniref:Uncharacterized protein n=1 Tax=Reticulomyxa filosa TaxID=46433 RepID=X6MLA6_RETFI|nr:hypothetical protein RFI_23519 [Reticulomyxa filosa]|eukprot:ETO13850.1 hypothetical protein RFI_23519 [Reticulomyxa filosa]
MRKKKKKKEPNVPLVLLELELKEKTVSNLPKSVREALNGVIEKSKTGAKGNTDNSEEKSIKDTNTDTDTDTTEQKTQSASDKEKTTSSSSSLSLSNIDFYFEIHKCPKSQTCQHAKCDNKHESNLMFHTWLFKGVDSVGEELEAQDVMWMGIFEPCNIFAAHIDDVHDALDRGAPINVLEKRSLFLV